MTVYSCITPGYDKKRDDLLMLPPLNKFKDFPTGTIPLNTVTIKSHLK